MPRFTGLRAEEEESGRTASPWEENKRKTNTKMEGQCKERPGVGGGRHEGLGKVATTLPSEGT